MAKVITDAVLDLIADDLIANGNEEVVCDTLPTTYAQAHTTYMLATHVLAAGDYTKANGDTDGRKVTIAAQDGVPVTNGGDAIYVAILDSVGELIKLITPCAELMTLDVAPGGAGWAVGDTITGQTSNKTCVIVQVLSAVAYYVQNRSGAFTLGEVLTNGVATADQGVGNPVFTNQALVAEGTVDIPAFSVTLRDPT